MVRGDSGWDDIYGGKGLDDFLGKEGNNFLNAADNRRGDSVLCVRGNDVAIVNRNAGFFAVDLFEACETVYGVVLHNNAGARPTASTDVSTLGGEEVDDTMEAGY